jgi:hypothetical protein
VRLKGGRWQCKVDSNGLDRRSAARQDDGLVKRPKPRASGNKAFDSEISISGPWKGTWSVLGNRYVVG